MASLRQVKLVKPLVEKFPKLFFSKAKVYLMIKNFSTVSFPKYVSLVSLSRHDNIFRFTFSFTHVSLRFTFSFTQGKKYSMIKLA